MKHELRDFNGWITELDLGKIDSMGDSIIHPIIYLLDADRSGCSSSTYYNTFSAIKMLLDKDPVFMDKEKRKLFKDRNNDSAILGEIRCYSILKKCFDKQATYIKESLDSVNPDFVVKNGDEIVYVEVNTPQMNGNEADRLVKQTSLEYKGISEICYRPYGGGKGTTAQNVISKLTAVKEDSSQLSKENINILWIDLQDQYMDGIDNRLEFESPYFSGSHSSGGEAEGVYSNEIWYALYGKKGMPLFDGQTTDSTEGRLVNLARMLHDGRFNQIRSRYLDAIIIYSPNHIAIFDNPKQHKRIPDWFYERFISAPRFSSQSSKCKYLNKYSKLSLFIENRKIKRMARHKFYSW